MLKETNSFNKNIGNKIKVKREELNWTQTKLGNKLGVTFQQVQKYEKGKNGCSAYRLKEISKHLKVPIIYFFEQPLILTKEVEVKNAEANSELLKEEYANNPTVSFEMKNGKLVVKGNPFNEEKK